MACAHLAGLGSSLEGLGDASCVDALHVHQVCHPLEQPLRHHTMSIWLRGQDPGSTIMLGFKSSGSAN